ncbi:MAG: LysR family transcriptional regulator [Pseudomonadales bacterium]
MLNPQHLQTFCTLAELGHFTRTACALHMTQSGVSQHIRKLELQLKQQLVEREGGFRLTPSGREFLPEAQQILTHLEQLERRFYTDSAHEGKVCIMSPGSVGLLLYPQLLALQQRYRGLAMDYRFAPNVQISQQLQAGSVDIALTTQPTGIEDVQERSLGTEPLYLVTSRDTEVTSWAQLKALGFIDHPDGAYHASLLLGANFPEFQSVKQFKCAGFSNQISLLLEPVAMGLGFTVLPARAVQAFAGGEHIAVQPLAVPCEEALFLSMRRSAQRAARIDFISEHIVSLLAS